VANGFVEDKVLLSDNRDDRAGKLACFNLFVQRSDYRPSRVDDMPTASGSARGNTPLAGEPASLWSAVASIMSVFPNSLGLILQRLAKID